MEAAPNVPKVYGAIASVMAALSKEGIAKLQRNQQQGYQFRGIDSIYEALSSKLVEHKLLMLPRVVEEKHEERTTKNGGLLIYATLKMEYDLISVEDGSLRTVSTIGEAMDSGDKSSNKAMSAAYKYAAIQAFCIPTVGEPDADAESHEGLAPPPGYQEQQQQQPPPRAQQRTRGQTPRQAQQTAQQQQRSAGQQQGATQADVDALIMVFREASKGGSPQFNRSWEMNAGPARKIIFDNKKLMAEFQKTIAEVDQAEGNIPQ